MKFGTYIYVTCMVLESICANFGPDWSKDIQMSKEQWDKHTQRLCFVDLEIKE